jgi:hypothetical protein
MLAAMFKQTAKEETPELVTKLDTSEPVVVKPDSPTPVVTKLETPEPVVVKPVLVTPDSLTLSEPKVYDRLSYADINKLCKGIVEGPRPKDTWDRFCYNTDHISGIRHVTFTNGLWDGYIGEILHGFCKGFGHLYKETNGKKTYQEGIFQNPYKIKDRPVLIKGCCVTDDGTYKQYKRGTFLNGHLNGNDCTNQNIINGEIQSSFEGTFENGLFISGKSYILHADIMFENQPATVTKGLQKEEATITMKDGTTIVCIVADLVYRECYITKIHAIYLPDGCTITQTYNESVVTYVPSLHSTITGTSITSITKCKFNFPENFTTNMYEKWTPFMLKCYLLVNFPTFSTSFFTQMTRYVTSTKMLHRMEEKHYIYLGLSCVQYLQLETELEDRFGKQ